jgi:flagellar biogenesis protein FliO
MRQKESLSSLQYTGSLFKLFLLVIVLAWVVR